MPALINRFLKTCLSNPNPLRSPSRFVHATNYPSDHKPCRRPITFSIISGDKTDRSAPRRTYQVIVAATHDMGIGKEGELPWKLPSDLKFFKQLTTTTSHPSKRNAVLMGRKTWESVPVEFRPLPARLNVVLSRSAPSLHCSASGEAIVCGSVGSALESLALPPYSHSVEKVFVIGGGQVLRELLNGPDCDAIHITEIETRFECDTFIPAIDLSLFRPLYSSETLVENNVRFRFSTYVRTNSDEFGTEEELNFLPKMIVERYSKQSNQKQLP